MPFNDPLLQLLSNKKELVFKLLRMANDAEFDGENTENAERFISFVDAREEMVGKLKNLDGEINKLCETHGEVSEAAGISGEIKAMTDQIARMELEISEKTLSIMSCLQKEIKELNARKKISSIYDSR